mgnify:CR=1 FL=1
MKAAQKSRFSDLIDGNTPVLVDFYADWCAPCKMMPPILKEVKRAVGDRAVIIKLDVDRNPEVANRYQVRSIPTLMIFKNGKPLFRQAGVMQARDLVNELMKHADADAS